jgi:dUTP pyrophosphatase
MLSSPLITIKRLHPERDKDIPLPQYMTSQAAGMDLRAAVDLARDVAPGAIDLIPTGLAIAIPDGFEAQIRPRSGLAIRYGITIINAPGTIDADYRGEIQVGIINLGKAAYTIKRGDRIAQMIIQRVYQARITVAEELPPTDRGSGGFGHTGVS